MGLKIALCQAAAVSGDVGENLRRALSIISQTRADVYVFPELFLTGYGADCEDLEEDVRLAVEKIRLRCMEHDIAVVVGAPTYHGAKVRNSLLFITSDKSWAYDKLYPARFGMYAEHEKSFEAGRSPVMAEFKGMRFGLSICYDIFFPEIYRSYAVAGADVNVCISASADASRAYLERVLPARSLENVLYTVFVNNISSGEPKFYGGSRLVGPLGDTLAEAGGGEDVLCVFVDRDVVDNARKTRRHLDDLRSDIRWL
ncbi:MAG: carbon-nitrogen hydrolase family protein [Candidatus Methanoplasma sp.]|jgi:predicted amidohydrolase|nr:carbon-nitrogen hydrolase family protein [Candidatus Methanoplasma sp.]